MSVLVMAIIGAALLLCMAACIWAYMNTKRTVFRTLAIVFGALAGIFVLYCVAALLLIAGIH